MRSLPQVGMDITVQKWVNERWYFEFVYINMELECDKNKIMLMLILC